MSKTFRLFISSTFDDFTQERETLQTKVFPFVKKYAAEKGYTFQPIDLRWGVSDEAQFDQKTLVLCLDEVRACKTHVSPNFLVMIGDRYGWIPLPYIIEEQELNKLLSLMIEEEKTLLKEWYKLDVNQIPTSYVLKERIGNYTENDMWFPIENRLRDLLQKQANISSLTNSQKQKYFQSATDAEIQEGLLHFKSITPFQKETLNERDDSQHIFGFFRDVDTSTRCEHKFIKDDVDYSNTQEFKQAVQKNILVKNTLKIKTQQINEKKLNEEYLSEFERDILNFLKNKIDEQEKNDLSQSISPLLKELEAQNYFAITKRKNFLSQEEPRKFITNYIHNDQREALVVYGKSGSGKSALMSKAIQEQEETLESKIVYRFVGATAHSSTTMEVLSSIFEELSIDISAISKEDNFEEFSYRVYDAWFLIKEKTTIFIDAVDQFHNKDQFLWLPQKLPSNVKIIISTLVDNNYKEDSQYFELLKSKTENLIQIPKFDTPIELLKNILLEYNRTLDNYQEEYFLKQYNKVESPLYVTLAAQEIKNWKSGDTSQTLASSQKELISEYIGNLTDLYHHDKEFVTAVLFLLYVSKDGLSEDELLELLAQNEDFINRMAPETWHKNLNKELPLIHWSRLHTQLKPFLSSKTQNGKELMYFFHREFEDVIANSKDIFYAYKGMLKSSISLISKYQNNEYKTNRWGYLFFIATITASKRYDDKDAISLESKKLLIEIGQMLLPITNFEWIKQYVLTGLSNIEIYESQQENSLSLLAAQHLTHLSFMLSLQEDSLRYDFLAISTGTKLATLYTVNNQQTLSQEILASTAEVQNILHTTIIEELDSEAIDVWIEKTTSDSIEDLTYQYIKHLIDSDIDTVYVQQVLKPNQEWLDDIFDPLYIISGTIYTNFASTNNFLTQQQFKEAHPILQELEDQLSRFYMQYPQYRDFEYCQTLNEEKKFVANQLEVNYYNIVILFASSLLGLGEEGLAKNVLDGIEDEINSSYEKDSKIFAGVYIKYLASYAAYADKDKEQAVTNVNTAFTISTAEYETTPYSWSEMYLTSLNSMILVLNYSGEEAKGLKYALISVEVARKLYKKNKNRFIWQYLNTLLSLAISHGYLKNKKKARGLAYIVLGLAPSEYFKTQANEILRLASNS